jgi:hypothetical protein
VTPRAAARRALVPAVLAGALVAFGLTSPTSSAAAVDQPGGNGWAAPDAGVAQRHRQCTLYANGVGFGAVCGSGEGGPARTWRDLLAGNRMVPCRDDPIPAGFIVPPPPRDARGRYWMESCIVDYDLGQVGGGPNAHVETALVWIPAGDRVRDVVPPWMTWLWRKFETAYPLPVLAVGPTARPRVNVPAYFWLPPASSAPLSRRIYDGRQWITMQARLVRLVVHPGVAAQPPVECGTGVAAYDFGADPFTQRSTCAFTYRRSSASMPGQTYPARADADWQVGFTDSAGYHLLGVFTVSSLQRVAVQEVQAVVQ